VQTELSAEAHAVMLDAASGAAGDAELLMAAACAELSGAARAELALAEAVGAAFLDAAREQAPQAPVSFRPRASRGDRDALRAALAAVRLARLDPDAIAWRHPIPHVATLPLGVPGARLIRLGAGRALPCHDHEGEERTLVLAGAFEDESGRYAPGDVSFADAGVSHAPRALRYCVCLIAASGAMKFRDVVARAAYRMLWR
jgi:putative transcriptional regulator